MACGPNFANKSRFYLLFIYLKMVDIRILCQLVQLVNENDPFISTRVLYFLEVKICTTIPTKFRKDG